MDMDLPLFRKETVHTKFLYRTHLCLDLWNYQYKYYTTSNSKPAISTTLVDCFR